MSKSPGSEEIVSRLLTMMFFFSVCAQGQWQANGTAVCDTSANKGFYMLPQIVTDSVGGVFVCWTDARSGNDFDIYMQRIFPDGNARFAHNGVALCNANGNQQFPRMISDRRGGAFVAWEDGRTGNSQMFVQRISNAGQVLWAVNGVLAASTPGLFVRLASDNSNGVFVAWNSGADLNQVTAQHLDSLGNRMWSDSGVLVSSRQGILWSNDVAVMSDDAGGAMVAWSQGDFMKEQVFIQRIDSAGRVQWAANGIAVSDTVHNVGLYLTSDSRNGGIVSWTRNDSLQWAQRIGQDGTFRWGSGGVLLGQIGGGRDRQTPDGHGGAYIGHWHFIQHIDSAGSTLWTGQGAQFTIAKVDFSNSTQARNGTKGLWCFYSYNEGGLSTSLDIRGQYIDSLGNSRWGTNGIGISVAPGIQDWVSATADNEGSAILAWDDFRNGHSNVYASKVDTLGEITKVEEQGALTPSIPQLEQNYPNPFNPDTKIGYSLSSSDRVSLAIFDVLGRRIATLFDQDIPAGSHSIVFDAKDISSGIYFYSLKTSRFRVTKKMVVIH